MLTVKDISLDEMSIPEVVQGIQAVMLLHFSNIIYKCTRVDYHLLQWASAIENLECGDPGSDKNFGMQQRPDGDIEIDEKFWEEDFDIPNCEQCNGMLKPDVSMSFKL